MNFQDYAEYFRGEIARLGPQAILTEVLPHVIDGLSGDLLHAVIELGYYFESPGSMIHSMWIMIHSMWICVDVL